MLEGRATGIGTIVEMTPIGLGRRPAGLRAVAEATGVPIIAASGYHRDAHYPEGHWVHRATVETLADRIFADLTDGMHPADWIDPGLPLDPARAGAIKGGASYHHISRGERRRLEAIAARLGRDRRRHPRPQRGRDRGPRDRRPARGVPEPVPTGSPSRTWTGTRTGSSTPRWPRAA